MKPQFFSLSLFLAGAIAAGTGHAQDAAASKWAASVSATAVGTQSDVGEDATGFSGSVSLERAFANSSFGVSLGIAEGEDDVPAALTISDTSAFDAAAWIGFATGPLDIEFGAAYGKQNLDGSAQAPSTAALGQRASRLPAQLRGTTLSVDGDRTSTGVSFAMSRTFGDLVKVTPSLAVGYSRTETEGTALSANASDPIGSLSDTQEGTTGSLGVSLSRALSESADWTLGFAALATDNAAAETLITGRAADGPVRRVQAGEGGEEWAELNGELGFDLGSGARLGLSIGGTIGREQEDVIGGVSLSRRF